MRCPRCRADLCATPESRRRSLDGTPVTTPPASRCGARAHMRRPSPTAVMTRPERTEQRRRPSRRRGIKGRARPEATLAGGSPRGRLTADGHGRVSTREGEDRAEAARAVPSTLHTTPQFADEPGDAVPFRPDAGLRVGRRLRGRTGANERDRALRRRIKREHEAAAAECQRRRHSGQEPASRRGARRAGRTTDAV